MISMRLCYLVLGITLLAGNARASEPMHAALTPVANDCQKWLAGRKYKSVCIAEIVGPRTYPTSAGPGIRLALVDLLRRRNLDVKDRAPIAISITYRPRNVTEGRDRDRRRLVVVLRIVFSDNRENEPRRLRSENRSRRGRPDFPGHVMRPERAWTGRDRGKHRRRFFRAQDALR